MNILHVIFLSIVEGLTEFLPISSTGHLILASKLMGLTETNFIKTFEIVIQFGAIMAVVALYTKKFLNIKLLKKLIVAFIPTAIVGFTLYPIIKSVLLGSSAITLNALFWGGVVLIIVELIIKKVKNRQSLVSQSPSKKQEVDEIDYSKVSYKKAFLIGCFQCLSIIPGVSRAAATIIGGLSTGLNRSTATEFSFLLAVPTMMAASTLDIYKSREYISQTGTLTLVIGTVLSFIFAMLAIKFLINFVKKHDFTGFGIYRICLSILFWIFVK
jgi:undecaprenyl-diphosphatase